MRCGPPDFYPSLAGRGYVELAREEPRAALGYFDRALAVRADYLSALVGRGEALLALQREADAIARIRTRACRRSGADRRPRGASRCSGSSRSSAIWRRPGRPRRRAGATRRFSCIGPRSSRRQTAPSSIGSWRLVEARRGDADAALEHFRRAVELDPSDAASIGADRANPRDGATMPRRLRLYDEALAIEPSADLTRRRGRAARTDRAGAAARRVPGHRRRAADHARRPGGAHRRPPRACCSTPVARGGRRHRPAQPLGGHVDHDGGAGRRDGGLRQPHVSAARGRRRAELAEAVARLLADLAPQERIRRMARRAPSVSPMLPTGHLAYPGGVGGGRVRSADRRRRRQLPAVAARDRRGSGRRPSSGCARMTPLGFGHRPCVDDRVDARQSAHAASRCC